MRTEIPNTARRKPKNMTWTERIVWGADYPENVVGAVNVLMGLLILNPYVSTLNLAVFGRFLLSIIPQEGVWGALFLALGIAHTVIRNQRDNRLWRRGMCLIAMLLWIGLWSINVWNDWRSTGTIILLVMVVNAWVAYRRLADRKNEGPWDAQRRD